MKTLHCTYARRNLECAIEAWNPFLYKLEKVQKDI